MNKFILQLFFTLFVTSVTLVPTMAQVQTSSDKIAVKEWLIANKDKMTLLSVKEYQKMSPAVKAVLDADKRTLVYDQEVTVADVRTFEDRNTEMSYVTFQRTKENLSNINKSTEASISEKEKIERWREQNRGRNIKIISKQNYESRPASERTYIDNLSDKIIYTGTTLTWEEVERFEQSKR